MTDTMHSDLNPYAPGSGRKPPELSGRDAEINAFDLTVARTRKRNSSRGMVLLGLRGVGKTVLLKRFAQMAERADWLIVEIESTATAGGALAVRQRLARALISAGGRFNRVATAKAVVTEALSSISSFSLSIAGVSVGLGIAPNPTRANSGKIEIDLEELVADLAPALRANSTALGIFIDEMQEMDDELLSALLTVQHKAGQNDWPFFVIGAGLPSLPAILSASRSYAERLFDYRTLGALDHEQAREAVVRPAERLNVMFSPDAVDEVVSSAEGYPYFLQTFAMKAWDIAVGKTIELPDAVAGIADGRLDLDMGFYPARWDRATPAERRYLVAMSEHKGGECATSDLAVALGSSQQRLSTIRHGLIKKGIIYARERGSVAFTVPGMSSFIQRQGEQLDDVPND